MTDVPAHSERAFEPGFHLPARLFALTPFYGLLVRREARRIIAACGRSAADYARQEAEDTVSVEWARFMRRVAARIERKQALTASA